MKKIILTALAVLLAATLMLSFASCRPVSAYELIDNAETKTEALNSADMTMEILMDLSGEGFTMNMSVESVLQTENINSEAPCAYMSMSVSMLWLDMQSESYYSDGYYYISQDGQNYKYKGDFQPEEFYGDLNTDVTFPQDLFDDAEIKYNADKTITVNLIIPKEEFEKLYENLSDDTSDLITSITEGADFQLSDCDLTFNIDKNGYVSSRIIVFSISFITEGSSMTMDVTGKLNYINPGSEVTITPPEGYETFPETDY